MGFILENCWIVQITFCTNPKLTMEHFEKKFGPRIGWNWPLQLTLKPKVFMNYENFKLETNYPKKIEEKSKPIVLNLLTKKTQTKLNSKFS